MPLLAAALVAGVVLLFSLRFSAGDVYPIYSSLRSDPLGTRGLFESLDSLELINAVQNYKNPRYLANQKPSTIFLAGVKNPWLLLGTKGNDIARLASEGSRVVISFALGDNALSKNTDLDIEEFDIDEEDSVRQCFPAHFKTQFTKNWGLGIDKNTNGPMVSMAKPDYEIKGHGLPDQVMWRGNWYFDTISRFWNPVYTVNGHPVMIERKLGKGSVVFAADSYFLSNEAMKAGPYAGLILWLIKPNTTVIIDEWHLNIAKTQNIATLVRKYGLAPMFFSLIFLALLYVWKNSVPLVPRKSADSATDFAGEYLSTKGYAQAMVSLLRRNFGKYDILNKCFVLWEQSAAMDTKISGQAENQIREIIKAQARLPNRQKDPVAAYKKACEIFLEGNQIREKL